MTIAWSIRMPIEIAIPASDMMFDGMPNSRIRMNDTRTANGNVTQITNALPTCIRIEQHGHRCDDRFMRQDFGERVNGPVDQPGPVVEGDDPHAGRQPA